MSKLEAIRYSEGCLEILDQLALPLKHEYIRIRDTSDGWMAIKKMHVRGAPAIAIVGIISLAVELSKMQFNSLPELIAHVEKKLIYLVSARPTAVNVQTASDTIRSLIQQYEKIGAGSACDLKEKLENYAADMLQADICQNKSIGQFGAAYMCNKLRPKKKLNVLTICNTGSLATAGYGTALGVVRSLMEKNSLELAWFLETRPYSQGSRLTAYELLHDEIPSILLCDSASGYLMAKGNVDVVIVGADRIASNGDTANKIGTYTLAVLAKHHDIPFFVAAPFSSFDLSLDHGMHIPVEERHADEITKCKSGGCQLTPLDVSVWNPAFDITPGYLVTGGFITEFGVFSYRSLMEDLLRAKSQNDSVSVSIEEKFLNYRKQQNGSLSANGSR